MVILALDTSTRTGSCAVAARRRRAGRSAGRRRAVAGGAPAGGSDDRARPRRLRAGGCRCVCRGHRPRLVHRTAGRHRDDAGAGLRGGAAAGRGLGARRARARGCGGADGAGRAASPPGSMPGAARSMPRSTTAARSSNRRRWSARDGLLARSAADAPRCFIGDGVGRASRRDSRARWAMPRVMARDLSRRWPASSAGWRSRQRARRGSARAPPTSSRSTCAVRTPSWPEMPHGRR